MSLQINYNKNLTNKNTGNLILFTDEKFNIINLKQYLSSSEYSFVSELIKINNSEKKILEFNYNSKKKIILISLKNDINSHELENLGAKFYNHLKNYESDKYYLNSNSLSRENLFSAAFLRSSNCDIDFCSLR